MDAECPKCKSQNFDVCDINVVFKEEHLKCECVCTECFEEFLILATIIIDMIE